MFGFTSGLVLGIVLATVGVNGIVKLSDNVLDGVQDRTRRATYPENVQPQPQLQPQVQPQVRQVLPNISQDARRVPVPQRIPEINLDMPSYDPYNGTFINE